jgi:hypothetical protein
MLADASNLGDPGSPSFSGVFVPSTWITEFKQEIHGLILITGDCHATVDGRLADIEKIFLAGEENATIHEVLTLVGDVRPGDQSAHEQFVSRLPTQKISSADDISVASASSIASHSQQFRTWT